MLEKLERIRGQSSINMIYNIKDKLILVKYSLGNGKLFDIYDSNGTLIRSELPLGDKSQIPISSTFDHLITFEIDGPDFFDRTDLLAILRIYGLQDQ